MTDITLHWRAYGAADANTDYEIWWNGGASAPDFDLLVTRDATDRGDGQYAPRETTLLAGIANVETSLSLASTTGFLAGDRVKIDRETIILGPSIATPINDCVRGADGTIRRQHLADAAVYAMHESYLHAGVDFGSRKALRYQIVTVLSDGTRLTAAEATAVKPSLPPSNDYTVVWGLIDRTTNVPVEDVSVSLVLSGHVFNPGTAES